MFISDLFRKKFVLCFWLTYIYIEKKFFSLHWKKFRSHENHEKRLLLGKCWPLPPPARNQMVAPLAENDEEHYVMSMASVFNLGCPTHSDRLNSELVYVCQWTENQERFLSSTVIVKKIFITYHSWWCTDKKWAWWHIIFWAFYSNPFQLYNCQTLWFCNRFCNFSNLFSIKQQFLVTIFNVKHEKHFNKI